MCNVKGIGLAQITGLLSYATLCLQEPPKQQLLAYEAGQVALLPRLAFCILQTPPEFAILEALVDLQSDGSLSSSVISWVKVCVHVSSVYLGTGYLDVTKY